MQTEYCNANTTTKKFAHKITSIIYIYIYYNCINIFFMWVIPYAGQDNPNYILLEL